MLDGRTIVLVLAGGLGAMMLGVSLGNSAISQINPIHFRGAALHPRDRGAAIDPNRPTVIPNNYEQVYGWGQGRQARAVACPECSFERPAPPADVRIASATYFGSREEEARREAREQREIDAAYERRVEEAERRRELTERLARYTHYRVSEDEVVRERPFYAQNDVVLTDDRDDDQK